MSERVIKLTVSVPKNIVAATDEIARERHISRSKLVAACLQELAAKHLCEQMEEGYKALSRENRETAEEAMELQSEVVPKW